MQSEKFFRPDVKEIYEILCKHQALIVHFSGAPKGSGLERENHLYPNDLDYVLDGSARSGVSCSTVMPGDCFHGYKRNATGSIGVILGLESSHSLIDAHPHDCGSMLDDKGNRITQNSRDITIEELENTILSRDDGDYNEWVICEYEVLGIFAVEPLDISYLTELISPPDMPDYLQSNNPELDIRRINFHDVINEFKSQPIYTFHESKICLVTTSGFEPISHKEIYK